MLSLSPPPARSARLPYTIKLREKMYFIIKLYYVNITFTQLLDVGKQNNYFLHMYIAC